MNQRRKITHRKRRRRWQNQSMVAGTAGVLMVSVLIAGAALWKKNSASKADSTATEAVQTVDTETEPQETEVRSLVIGGVEVGGMSRQEAEALLKKELSGNLKVRVGEEIQELQNPVDAEISRLLDQAEADSGDLILELDQERIAQDLDAVVAEAAGRWNRKAVSSTLESFDKETGAYTYTKEQNGQTLAQDRLKESLLRQIQAGTYDTPVDAVFSEEKAERTQQETKDQYRVIGTFSTQLTNNKNRNENVRLAMTAVNGTVLQPGEEFSFNKATGNRTKEKGYQPAGAYRNGVLIEEPGGGVCQVSTTLYHAIIYAGFKTTERNAHSYAPSYVPGGQDAMVSYDGYDGPDLKFKNTSSDPIVLRASMDGLTLKMSIVGIPILEEGTRISIRSEKVRDVEVPEPVYEEDTTLPYGTEKVVDAGKAGSVWKSYRVTTQNGQVVKEEPLHNSTYKAKTPKIKRNTTAPGVGESTAAGDTNTAGTGSTSGGSGSGTETSSTSGGSGSGTETSGTSGGSGSGSGTETSGASGGSGTGSGTETSGASGGSGTGTGNTGTSGGSENGTENGGASGENGAGAAGEAGNGSAGTEQTQGETTIPKIPDSAGTDAPSAQ